MRISPLDVHEQTFRMAFRGFDPSEVDAFLQRVADELERLIEERDRARADLEEEKSTRSNLEQALSAARSIQDNILDVARKEAEVIESQARVKADRVLASANESLVRLRREILLLQEHRSLWLAEISALAATLDHWVQEKAEKELGEPALISDPEGAGRPPSEPAPKSGGEDDAV